MSKRNIIRAWKDVRFRKTLTSEELALLPENPAGIIDLSDQDLSFATGGTTVNSQCASYCPMTVCSACASLCTIKYPACC
jgi:mersacidin/lichenicidin family type 2 lantibiotic